MFIRTEGLVLRTTEYKDTDRILTVLTRDRGRLTVKARAVRTARSRIKGGCQLFCYSEFTLFEKEGYLTVNEATVIESFEPLRRDLERLSLAGYFAQTAEVLSQEDLPNPALLSLVLNGLYVLCKDSRPPALIKAAFELRLACIAGYAPQLDGCMTCGNEMADRFLVSGGTLSCAGCGGEGLRLPIGPAALAAMRYVCSCEDKRIFAFSLESASLKEFADIAETYLVTQLERGFSALDYYKSIQLI